MSSAIITHTDVLPTPAPAGWEFNGTIVLRGRPPITVRLFVPEPIIAYFRQAAGNFAREFLSQQQFGWWGTDFGCNDNFGGVFDSVVDVVHDVASSPLVKSIPFVGDQVSPLIAQGVDIYKGIRNVASNAGRAAGMAARQAGMAQAAIVDAVSRAEKDARLKLQERIKTLAASNERWAALYDSAKKAAVVNRMYRGRAVNPVQLLSSGDSNAIETGRYLLASGKDIPVTHPPDRPFAAGELTYNVQSAIAGPYSSWGNPPIPGDLQS